MASKKLLDMLNEAISNELQVSVQYMWQHVVCRGVNSESVGGVFKSFAIAEMKHAEALADRLDYLGGKPTTKPSLITVGDTIKSMLSLDKKAEGDAIALYRKIIAVAEAEKDVTTRTLIEGILSDEEDHHNRFTTLLEAD